MPKQLALIQLALAPPPRALIDLQPLVFGKRRVYRIEQVALWTILALPACGLVDGHTGPLHFIPKDVAVSNVARQAI